MCNMNNTGRPLDTNYSSSGRLPCYKPDLFEEVIARGQEMLHGSNPAFSENVLSQSCCLTYTAFSLLFEKALFRMFSNMMDVLFSLWKIKRLLTGKKKSHFDMKK